MWLLAATGVLLELCFAGMVVFRDLRQHTVPFLMLFGAASVAYAAVVVWSLRRPGNRKEIVMIWTMALLFRVTLLFSAPPTLSDDVYRYIWDGRLLNSGINPYGQAVSSPGLDAIDTPLRQLVNHPEMASPYLPSAQVVFAAVYRASPENPAAFQVASVLFDLLTGLLVFDLLRRVRLSLSGAVIYLWSPLVVVEFAHGAHVDSLMLFLMMAALWLLVAARQVLLSAAVLAAATLTKGLPLLLLPVVARRWGWRSSGAYAGLIVLGSAAFARSAGWGLTGPLDGTGLFGALRIYANSWNYNGGLYHWLEISMCGYPAIGPVPPEIAGWWMILCTKLIVAGGLGVVLAAVWWLSGRIRGDLELLRLAIVPLGAYLLLTTTVHPWYVVLIVPLLPFLTGREGEQSLTVRFLLPGLYFSGIVALSYLTYVDPDNLREYRLVRLLEYIPLYAMLIWAAWPAIVFAGRTGKG